MSTGIAIAQMRQMEILNNHYQNSQLRFGYGNVKLKVWRQYNDAVRKERNARKPKSSCLSHRGTNRLGCLKEAL
jgi:hypothetical protein